MAIKTTSKKLIYLAVGLVALVGACGYIWLGSERAPIIEVFVFDLPGYPAVLVRTPTDKRILINGGSNAAILRRLTSILPFYSRHIDIIIATNNDDKNTTGLIDVINRYSVNKIILPAVSLQSLGLAGPLSPIYKTFLETVERQKIPIEYASEGDSLVLDQGSLDNQALDTPVLIDQVLAKILFPVSADKFKYSKASSPELILRLEYGTTSTLLLGNSSAKVQKFLKTSPVDVVIVTNSTAPTKTTYKTLIFSKAKTKTASKATGQTTTKTANKKEPDGFNVRDEGVVKIISDGTTVRVEKTI